MSYKQWSADEIRDGKHIIDIKQRLIDIGFTYSVFERVNAYSKDNYSIGLNPYNESYITIVENNDNIKQIVFEGLVISLYNLDCIIKARTSIKVPDYIETKLSLKDKVISWIVDKFFV